MTLSYLLLSLIYFCNAEYTDKNSDLFVGSQHWWESGWYGDKGFESHYDGYFCLCDCHASPEGIFCSGGGITPDGSPVAKFLGVFEHNYNSIWQGSLVAFNNTKPFADSFQMEKPGGKSNYTGVSQSLNGESFVWRGYMSGADCQYSSKCVNLCGPDSIGYNKFLSKCKKNSNINRVN